MSTMNPGPSMLGVLQFVALRPNCSRSQLEERYHHGAVNRAVRAGLIANHGTKRLCAFRTTPLGDAVLVARGLGTAPHGTADEGDKS